MTPVRLLLDATSIPENRGGVGRYLRELVPALARRDDVELHVACQRRDVAWLAADAPRAIAHPQRGSLERVPVRLLWEQVGLPRLARRLGAEVLHCPHYTMPLVASVPTIVTLHDATFFSHPEAHSTLKRRFFRWWIARSLRHAAACVTPSAATRDEVLRWTGADARDRVHVALHGVDTVRYAPERAAEAPTMRTATGIGDDPYLAFVGTVEPRKRVTAILDAIAGLRADGDDVRVVLAGGAGWDTEAVDRLRAGADGATWLGFVDDELLPPFLASSAGVVYPSIAEGFGLPVLEAMASGVPVITVPRLAIPEVAGDTAIYCEPEAASIADAIRRLLADPGTAAELGRRGRERALGFTWDACADAHVVAYRQAVAA